MTVHLVIKQGGAAAAAPAAAAPSPTPAAAPPARFTILTSETFFLQPIMITVARRLLTRHSLRLAWVVLVGYPAWAI